jgi:hypothetical protein
MSQTLTELDISYWKHAGRAFGWSADLDHRCCPLKDTYQIARNVLAACVTSDHQFDEKDGHALSIYDLRNPAMSNSGKCEFHTGLRLARVRESKLSAIMVVSFHRHEAALAWRL